MGRAQFENRYFRFLNSWKHWIVKLSITYSRFLAHQSRRKIIKKKGGRVVNRQIKKSIKEYAKRQFGKKSYWPYLALYTEIRGQFIQGWLPFDYYRYILLPRINPRSYCELSEHKTFDHRIFGDFALKPLLVYISGMFLNSDFEVVARDQVKKILFEYNDTIVVKEEIGTQGKQVQVIHSSEFKTENLKIGRNYIIQPYVKQYKPIHNLYSESVNTLRVTTFLKKDGSVDIKFVILRFGSDGSKVDNISVGGQYIYFDSDGKPSKNAFDNMGFNMGERHKNSGYLFADLELPMYQEVMNACIAAHKKYPYVRLVGWDVCITDTGEPKLIEWNTSPGIHRFESRFGPFFTDDDLSITSGH